MITEAFFIAVSSVVTFLVGLLPTLEPDSGYEFVSAYIYPAYKSLADFPVLGAFVEVLTIIAIFEVTLLGVRLGISLFRTFGIIKYSPLPYD